MSMSTQTLGESARVIATAVLLDRIQILDVVPPVTVGYEVTRALTEVGDPVAGLVQTTVLQNASESNTESFYSVKVAQATPIKSGQAVRVEACLMEPELVGKVLLLDKVSLNGLAMLRKAVATDFEKVNQEGKEGLS